MKVCLLTRKFDLSGAGIGRVSGEIQKRLLADYEVTSISDGNSLSSYARYSLFGIRPQITKDCDVYHALTPVEALWIPKGKSIVTFHDLFPIAYPDRQGAGIGRNAIKQKIARQYFAFCSAVASRCKVIACNSTRTKEDIVHWLGVASDRVHVIKLGINEDLEPQKKIDDVFCIGYLGQLDRRKRVDLLVKAFRESELDAELVIAGTGIEEDSLRKLAGNDRRIKFLGFLSDTMLKAFYNSLDLFVFPSYVEGYGLPIVEAMACKKPVVVLADSIIPGEVRNRCAIVDDLDGFFMRLKYNHRRIDSVLKHYEGFGWEIEENYTWAKRHDWNTTVAEYIKLYSEVCK